MLIAHLSDLHVTEGPALEDQREDLTRIVGQVLEARPDLVITTGDYYGRTVPHRPSPRERGVLEPLIVRLADVAPVLLLEGNHDHGESLALAAQLGGVYPVRVLDRAGSEVVHTPAGPVRVYWLAYPTRRWVLAGQERPPGVAEGRAQALGKIHGLLTAWRGRMVRQRVQEPETPILFLGHFQVVGSRLSSGEVLATGELEIERQALDTMPVDYGALGHVHARQELAPRWWYVGDPWPVDFGETGARGFHLVQVGKGPAPRLHVPEGRPPSSPAPWTSYPAGAGLQAVQVGFQDSGARPWITLRYRWAADREDGTARWITRPSPQELEAARGAVVRARLVVPDVHAASCPWDAELEALEVLAHRVKAERVIEPTTRVRSPEVAEAVTLEAKIEAWWGTLAAPPEPVDRRAALEALAELQESDDDQVKARTAEIVSGAKPKRVELERPAASPA